MARKAQILENAISAFDKIGIKRVSVEDICTNLSISKKTFYQSYREKEILVNEYVEAKFANHFSTFEILKENNNSAFELMVRYNQYLMKELDSVNPFVFYDLKYLNPRCYDLYFKKRNTLSKQFEYILQKGMDSGNFRSGIDKKYIAELRVTQLEEILLSMYGSKEDSTRRQYQLFELYLSGIVVNETPLLKDLKKMYEYGI